MSFRPIRHFLLVLVLASIFTSAVNGSHEILKTIQLEPNVYGIIGPTTNRTPENLGNNANFGLIITDEGLVLVDPGGSYLGAKQLHHAVRHISTQPIKYVINTGGQDHRWLGNGYFKKLGATIIANENAVEDQEARFQDQLSRLGALIGDEKLAGIEAIQADITFSESHSLELGGTTVEIHHKGHAHTPGDSFVWLPKQKILFSGDIIYVDRMLGINDHSSSSNWLTAFKAIAELRPKLIVPGHGSVCDLEKATNDSYRYIKNLRDKVSVFIEDGNGIEDIGKLDQSEFSYLANYDTLKGRNAQRVFEEMEWE